jgi:hypothetical protein
VAWPVPVERWQSSHEHMNIERTRPAIATLTAPQAQAALRSISGFSRVAMAKLTTAPPDPQA